MATDYIVFVHGVNTRKEREDKTYADKLIDRIDREIASKSSNITRKFIPLYWGDVSKEEEQKLLNRLQQSPTWKKMWFREFREKQLMQFVGDAALYISRHVGSKVVIAIAEQLKQQLPVDPEPDDRMHLVTHSWGTVILFDVLFAARWDNPDLSAYESVRRIRQSIFGVKPEPRHGIRLSSMHTLGSPIAFFNLINVVSGEEQAKGESELTQEQAKSIATHDITPQLEVLLEQLYNERGQKTLPWRNLMHPGDPVAYPLATIMPDLVDGKRQFLDIQDVVTSNADLSDFLVQPLSRSFLALLHGGDAHGSYWESRDVVKAITEVILQEAAQPTAVSV
ncbi:hypothetical protein [Gloeocapsopsis dulcis]|uniref:Alpha/beta hydrolase n=1 Tax=Gloeocapsopsis dulcis AAB1 = 1H9 TaxID=1433147 RepID=A0A6N8FWZ7_9CHRO|nr:hypothetical protein [Gloeocapsopsis dulcis]MUL37638.1 hypothetical protein [Gloeocapsopsis dulcis AAB1 = 1H9]WNN89228.1 hypothetical protein P0S91_23805 [Gloeocapsopsis dulcis]